MVLYSGLAALLASRLVYAVLNPLGYIRRPWLLLLQGGRLGALAAAVAGLGLLAWRLWRLAPFPRGRGMLVLLDALVEPAAWGTALALAGWSDPAALGAAAAAAAVAAGLLAMGRRTTPAGTQLLAAVTWGGLAAVAADFGHPVRALAGGVSILQLSAAGVAVLAALAGRRLLSPPDAA